MIWRPSRRLLLPLVPFHAGALEVKQWFQPPPRRLRHPVISVGSLSAGGAGKTPFVLALAERMHRKGIEVRILTRGYGRTGKLTERVISENTPESAARFGDEPLMLARRLPFASVWVGADRHVAGVLSEKLDSPTTRAVYLLDDGFQHRKLARDMDIILVTRQDLNDFLLPAGNLREPLSRLARATVLVLREDEGDLIDILRTRICGSLPPVLTVRRVLRFPEGVPVPRTPMVFCGLARPESFLSMLSAEAIVPAGKCIFRDHHPYSSADIDSLATAAAALLADGFIITEKDAVKLSSAMLKRLQAVGPVVVPRLEVELPEVWPVPDFPGLA